MSKRVKLKNLGVDKVDLVGRGDNPKADVLLYKAAPMVDCPKCGKQMPKGGKCPECGYKAKAAPALKDGGNPPTCVEILDTRAQADALQQLQYAFTDSMYGILYGGGDSKVELMRKNVEAFGERLRQITGKPADVVAMKSAGDDEQPEEFVKRASEWIVATISKARETMKQAPAALDVNVIPEAHRPAVVALQKSAADAETQVATLTAENATLKARVATLEGAAPEDEFAGMSEVMKTRTLADRAEIAKLRDERELDKRVAKTREAGKIPGTTPEALGAIFYRVEKGKGTTEERAADVVELERLLKSLTEQATANGGITREDGTKDDDDVVDDSALDAKKAAAKLVAEGKFPDMVKAYDHLLATNPDMRKRLSQRPTAGQES